MLTDGAPVDLGPAMPWRELGHGLVMCSLDRFKVADGPKHIKPNLSMMTLSYPGHCRIQYGPVIVMAYCTNRDSKVLDVTMRDFRSFIDWHRFGRANPCVPLDKRYPFSTWKVGTCQSVKINCEFDIKRFEEFHRIQGFSAPPQDFEQVLTTTATLNTPRLPWYFAWKVGLDWTIQQCTTNDDVDALEKPRGRTPWDQLLWPGERAGFMGLTPFKGSVLIVNRHGKLTSCSNHCAGKTVANTEPKPIGLDIYPHHVQALCLYLTFTLNTRFPRFPGNLQSFADSISMAGFALYWQSYKAARIGPDDGFVPSPYAIQESRLNWIAQNERR